MVDLNALTILVVLVLVAAAFTLSASAGLGGSLLLVPTLAFAIGARQGAALAALLLAANNLVKLGAYRATLPFRRALPIVAATSVGAWLGARALVAASDAVVSVAVIVSFVIALVLERWDPHARPAIGAGYALASGMTSGFSGTSGPLKGVAIRSLGLDRRHLVGAASLASFAGDATKVSVYADAGLLDASSWHLAAAAVPIMVIATLAGRRLNEGIGERGFAMLFWGVMSGYTARLIASL